MTRGERLDRHRSGSLAAMVGTVVLGGSVVAALVVASAIRAPQPVTNVPLVAVLVLGLIIGEVQPLQLVRRAPQNAITISLSFSIALMFLLPGYTAAVVAAAASVLGDLLRRVDAKKAAYNAAMITLSIAAGQAILLNGNAAQLMPLDQITVIDAVVMLMAFAAIYTVNSVLLCGVLAIVEGDSFRTLLRREFLEALPTDGILMPLGPVMAIIGLTAFPVFPFAVALTAVVFVSARNAAQRQRDAIVDPLTGLANRRLFDQEAEAASVKVERTGGRLALLWIDLNNFKAINDAYGHHIGDAVLQVVGQRIRRCLPDSAVVARLGGDEFAVLLSTQTTTRSAVAAAERVASVIRDRIVIDADNSNYTFDTAGAVGVAVSNPARPDLPTLARAADAAMYSAKRHGRSVELADPDAVSSGYVDALAAAIKHGEVSVAYQPVIDSRTGAVVAVEAVVSGAGAQFGGATVDWLSDIQSIPSLARPFGRMLLRDALETLHRLHRHGFPVEMEVNVTPSNLTEPDFVEHITTLADGLAIDAAWVAVEVTETAFVADLAATRRSLAQLSDRGFKTTVDDFGSDRSAISILRSLPLTAMKIDGALSADTNTDQGAQVLATLARLAQIHHLTVGAKDVASVRALQVAAAAGCNRAQGDAIAPAMTADQLTAWLHGRASMEIGAGVIESYDGEIS